MEESPYSDAAAEYLVKIKAKNLISMPTEALERKHSVRLKNFFLDRRVDRKISVQSEIRRFFMGCSYCIHISKVETCSLCGVNCGCYVVSFENEMQLSRALELNGTDYMSKKVFIASPWR